MRTENCDSTEALVETDQKYVVQTYDPLKVVIHRADEFYYYDLNGKRYLNFTASYSAQNWGIVNSRFVEVLKEQASILPLTSRAILNDVLPIFARELCELFGFDKLIPMNSGAEAVETAIKVARRWGVMVKGIPENKNEIIVFSNNFAGRTITIISFYSTDSEVPARKGFGPFTPGFRIVDFNSFKSFKEAVTENTCAVLFEPVQGEGGIRVWSRDELCSIVNFCSEKGILTIADEIQCGLYRTGKLMCCSHYGFKPDILVLGKSLGGGLVPISAVLSSNRIFEPMTYGSHGSTFGGNPLACRVALEVVRFLRENGASIEHNVERASEDLKRFLVSLPKEVVLGVRGVGLMLGVEIGVDPDLFVQECCNQGLIVGKARGNVVRLTPPLTITNRQIEEAKSILHTVCLRLAKSSRS